jgi:hypothetical protein
MEYLDVVKSIRYPMRQWHREHAEKVIVRFALGLPRNASQFERRNYLKYGTTAGCIRQIEYDMHHGVEKREIVEIIRRIGKDKKYAKLRSNRESIKRLRELRNLLLEIPDEGRFDWHEHAYKEKIKNAV